jgi:hypothetical protein
MSYSYTQLHEIIEKQYAKKASSDYDDDNRWWLFNEGAKYYKGYSTTSTLISNLMSGNVKPEIKKEDPPVHIDN